jgi:hypothetical protein
VKKEEGVSKKIGGGIEEGENGGNLANQWHRESIMKIIEQRRAAMAKAGGGEAAAWRRRK